MTPSSPARPADYHRGRYRSAVVGEVYQVTCVGTAVPRGPPQSATGVKSGDSGR